MIETSETLPITDSQIIPITDSMVLPITPSWRARLAPYRRHLFVLAVLVGSALGAGVFFATHA